MIAARYTVGGSPFTLRAAEWFILFSKAVLAMLKPQNIEDAAPGGGAFPFLTLSSCSSRKEN
ncbi:hypothetical protein MUO32_03270 [Shinella sp. CPCC 101442]|uniref:hypothetical protein n=1 Tax=Shinella sp. CPCC 101442 TaxID=2932265 RepID=UPI0021538B33|nr:hypothetical protein [Shinella sp. CPCC 101442]MCR6498046.1 hypothetical protein [Shinella sp. CPCC 101442]